MSFSKMTLAAIGALSLTSAPVLAQQATPASMLSVAGTEARTGATLENQSELGGGFLIPLLALGAIILGILVVIEDDEDATSP